MTAPLRIFHLAANRWWTGSADPIIQISRGLAGLGHEVILGVIPGDRFEAKARAAGLELLEGLSLDPRGWLHRYARDAGRLRRIIVERRIEIVHTHHSHDHWLACLALGLLTRSGNAAEPKPVLVRTVHNRRAIRHGWLARRLWARTHGVIAVSRGIEERCRAIGIEPGRLWTIGGIVDIDRFTPSCSGELIRREFGLGDRPVVGSVSRLAPNRGHELLLRAFQALRKRIPAARLLLVGKGENRKRLEQMARDLGLSDSVVFTGYRDGDLGEVLAALDCFVLPGAGSDESCRAALEAMAAGKPVVAPPVGALPETIVDGETGRLVPPGSYEALEEAMRELLGDTAKARKMGTAGRLRVVELFNQTRRAREIEECYEMILKLRRR